MLVDAGSQVSRDAGQAGLGGDGIAKKKYSGFSHSSTLPQLKKKSIKLW
jgi:hypothetical protein